MPSLRSMVPTAAVLLLLLPSLLACKANSKDYDERKQQEAFAAKHKYSPFEISPITATFAKPVTTYTVHVSSVSQSYGPPAAEDYVWATSALCGTFVGSGETATWSHPDKELGGDCPTEATHPGVIQVQVKVYSWVCKAIYTNGSAPGPGPDTEPCH